MNPKLLARAWRTRLYYYSSASTFARIATDLKAHVECIDDGSKRFRKVRNIYVYKTCVYANTIYYVCMYLLLLLLCVYVVGR